MAVALVDSRVQGYTAVASASFSAWPSSEPTVGHLAFLWFVNPGVSVTLSTEPAGWEAVFTNISPASADVFVWMYLRVLTGSDTLPSWAFSAATDHTVVMVTFTGQTTGTTAAELLTGSNSGGSASGITSTTTPTVTAAAGDLVVSTLSADTSVGPSPFYTVTSSGVTKEIDVEGTNAVEFGLADQTAASGGSFSHDWTLAAADSGAMTIMSIIPGVDVPVGNRLRRWRY